MPVISSPTRSRYSSYIISRSASRIRWRITCLAVCAAMRPKLSGVTSSRFICSSGTSVQSISSSSSVSSVWFFSPVSSSMRSSSSSARSRASSGSRTSRSGGSSIANTRKSPRSSSSTVACRAASGVFLYAARSASSSAATRVPLSIPFSRSISRTASTISWLIPLLPFLDLICPHDRVVRDVDLLALHGELDLALAGGDDRAARTARLGLDAHRLADGPLEMRPRAQGRLRPGRRDLDAVPVEIAAKDVRHALAECVVDALGVVDEDAEALLPVQLEGEHVDAGQCALDKARDVALERPLPLVHRARH